jgi:hypothetical protein
MTASPVATGGKLIFMSPPPCFFLLYGEPRMKYTGAHEKWPHRPPMARRRQAGLAHAALRGAGAQGLQVGGQQMDPVRHPA